MNPETALEGKRQGGHLLDGIFVRGVRGVALSQI